MNPRTPCCHHPDYRARGLVEQGNLPVHRHTAQRARCPTGGHTIAATTAPPFDRWRTAADVVPRVLTWLRHGGPPQAIVAAFGADARPVAAGVTRAGQPGQRGHQHVGHQGPVDLQPVQADALWVKRGGAPRVEGDGDSRAVAAVAGGRHQPPPPHPEAVLAAGMWLGGCADNFGWLHVSLRPRAPTGASWKWHERTPAMAAEPTGHRWTMHELLRDHGPLPPWVAPKRRGRPPSEHVNRPWWWHHDHGSLWRYPARVITSS